MKQPTPWPISGPYRKPVTLRARIARLALAAIAVAALAYLGAR